MRFLRPLLIFILVTCSALFLVATAEISEPNGRLQGQNHGGDRKVQSHSDGNSNVGSPKDDVNSNMKKTEDAEQKTTTEPPQPLTLALRAKQTKYFHEPGFDAESGHYDARYFQGKVPYEEHRPALRHLIRSYLTTFKALGIETWLAHGSLLGWWWNGRIMPWDYDLDVQVSVATLRFLAERYNRSTHEHYISIDYPDASSSSSSSDSGLKAQSPELEPRSTSASASAFELTKSNSNSNSNSNQENHAGESKESKESKKKIKKTYLLDVNPHYDDLTKGNGANIIDARWIDTSNGMFIDITGVRERERERAPGVWSCKNNHRYRTAELWPLRRTEFEGVEAWIPYAFDKVLTDEYGAKCLVTTEWAG